MKIMIVTDAWEPQVNGVVRTLKMTQRELIRLGYEVAFLTPQQFKSVPCPTYPEISLALATAKQVAKKMDEFAPDYLHIATEGPLGWMARSVALKRDWPFTSAYHSRFPEYIHARFRVPLKWSYALLRHFHNAARCTITPTMGIVNDLKQRGFLHAQWWTRGVDRSVFSPDGACEPRPHTPVFLHVGRLAVEKNVEAFLSLDLPGEKWIAGDGPQRQRLQAQYPHAKWLGVLDGVSLARLYRSADVFVFPSKTDTFGLVMAEAMACGTPVAAFPVAGPIDVVKDGVSGSLNEDLHQACLTALTMSRKEVAAHAEQFNWSLATEQFLAALVRIEMNGQSPDIQNPIAPSTQAHTDYDHQKSKPV